MIAQIIKKQLLILFRNPFQLLLLIGLPMILIAILGSALGSWMSGEEINIEFKLAIIENEPESEQVDAFIADLKTRSLPAEAAESIENAVPQVQPQQTLLNVLQSDGLKEMIHLEQISPEEKTILLEEGSHAAVIEIPAGFTYDLLNQLFFNRGSVPEIVVYQNEEKEIAANIVDQIVTAFQREYTLSAFLGEKGIDPRELFEMTADVKSETSSLDRQNPVSGKAYYTIGMVVMNVLFMATAVSSMAFDEKKSHVFDRIILADVSRWIYFIGVLLSGMILAFIQAIIVFTFAYAVFDVTWPDLAAFLITTIVFSIAVGGLGVLLTAVSYSANSEQIINFFSSVIVTLFAFIGGSFFPVGDSSSIIQRLGELTPNGAAMSAYLGIIRGESIVAIGDHIIYIFIFAFAAIIIGVLSFPKRGAAL